MSILKHITIILTFMAFICFSTGCATTGHKAETESSDSSSNTKTALIVAGVVAVVAVGLLVASAGGGKSSAEEIAGNIGRGT